MLLNDKQDIPYLPTKGAFHIEGKILQGGEAVCGKRQARVTVQRAFYVMLTSKGDEDIKH